ncbi:MAG: THUMP domain-containing protein, partial [Candidatus Gracilibacteria bacterium]
MKSFLLIHYGEIGLKNKNKEFFVKRLSQRIKERLSDEVKKDVFVKHYLGRFLVNNVKENDDYAKVLGRVAGIKNFYYVYEGSDDVKKLADEIWSVWNKKWKKKLDGAKTFCVRLKRSQKTDYRSCDAEKELGAILLKKGINLKVKMKNPDLNIHVEVFDGHGYFGFQKNDGIGGLPANTAGKFVALISAGIDSPVAAYRMMKRGARIVFV